MTPPTDGLPSTPSPDEMLGQLHEHQKELDWQKQLLEREQQDLGVQLAPCYHSYDLCPVAYCVLDANGQFLQANQPAAALLGTTELSLFGQPIHRFIKQDDHGWLGQFFEQKHHAGTSTSREVTMIRNDGTSFWAQLVVHVGRDTAARPAFGIAITDISESKHQESCLSAYARFARQLNETDSMVDAGRLVTQVADDLIGWDSAVVVVFDENITSCRRVLTIDLIDGRRQEVLTQFQNRPPSLRMRRTIEQGAELILRAADPDPQDPAVTFGDHARRSKSLMYVPICDGKKTIGLVSIQSYSPNAYDNADLETLQTLADYCAGALARILNREALDQSERRLRESQAIARMGNFYWDARTNKVTWSDELFRVYGHVPGEFEPSFERYIAAVHSDDRARVLEGVQTAMGNKGRFDHDYRVQRADGQLRWVHARGMATIGYDGTLAGLEGTCQDITERKVAEDELRLFRTLVDQSHDTFEIIDPETARYLDVNSSGPAEIGCTREEYLSKRVMDVDPIVTEELWREIVARIRTDGFITLESTHRRMDGTTFPMDVSARLVKLDREYIVAVVRNATERKRSEAALQASERELRLITNNMPGPVSRVDSEFRYLFVNDQYERLFGKTRDQVLDRTIADVIGPDSWERSKPYALRALAGEHVTFENKVPLSPDRHFFALVNYIPDFDENRKVIGFFVVAVDVTHSKKTEAELHISEARLRATIEGANIFSWEFCVETDRFTYVSFDKERLGYSREQWMQPGFWDQHLHPQDKDVTIEACLSDITKGVAHRLNYRMLAADGRIVHISEFVSEPDHRDGMTLVRGVALDVTEAVETREAIREQAERLDLAVTATDLGLWDWNPQTGQLLVSERWASMLGCEVNDLPVTTSAWKDRVHPDDLPKAWAAIERTMRDNTPYIVEHRLRHADGSWRWILAQARAVTRDSEGNVTRFVGSHQDVTARHEAAEQLQAATDSLEEAQALARIGSWSFHLTDGRVRWSKQVYKLFGRDESKGEPDYAGIMSDYHPDDARQLDAVVKQCISDGTPYTLILRTSQRDPSIRYVRGEGRARSDAQGNIIELFGTVSDVTAEIEREAALTIAQQQAEAANIAKSEFLANMSHEIRTPMTAILGFTELLAADDTKLPIAPERKEYIDTIQRNGQHLLSIINDILDLSKIEAGKMVVEATDTNLLETVSDVASLLSVRADEKKLQLDVRFDTTVPRHFKSDPVRIRQVLMNLVGNAVKFTQIGQVTLRVSFDPNNSLIRFDVADTGIGLNTAQLDRLFGAFVQADASTTRKFGGTGLGLQISKRLSQLLGGDITVVSQLGVGSTFTATMRVHDIGPTPWIGPGTLQDILRVHTNAPIKSAKTDPSLPLENVRILLAEDSLDSQRLISLHLRKAGAEVTVMDNGKLVVQSMTIDGTLNGAINLHSQFDLILTDMQMPEIDGFAMTRLLREKGCRLPILALTANAMSDELQKCLDAGCNSCISKPVDRNSLVSACAAAMLLQT